MRQNTPSVLMVSIILNIVFFVMMIAIAICFFSYSREKQIYKTNDKVDDETAELLINQARSWTGYYENHQYDARLTSFVMNEETGCVDVVFVGDSITSYGEWNEWYGDIKVINRGIGSDTSAGVLHRLDEILFRKPRKVFLMVGINDIASNIPPEKTIENINNICECICQKDQDITVYLESVLPSSEYDSNLICFINSELKEIASKSDSIEYIDLYPLFLVDGNINEEYFSADKVHLNGEGYRVWNSALEQYIND